jgi:hypothetical protein
VPSLRQGTNQQAPCKLTVFLTLYWCFLFCDSHHGDVAIAEGVETAAQLDFLREHSCDQIQGYFLGRPMTPEAPERFRQDYSPAARLS